MSTLLDLINQQTGDPASPPDNVVSISNRPPEKARISIATSAVLVSFKVRQWSPNKRDKKATNDLSAQHNNARDMARVNKTLLSSPELDAITKHVQNLRVKQLQPITQPWAHGGDLLLPTANLPEYMQIMDRGRKEFFRLVDQFIASYDFEIANVAIRLGDLYDPADYPTKEYVRGRFTWDQVEMPISDSNDWRIAIADDIAEDARCQYQAFYDNTIERTMREKWEALHEAIEELVMKLNYETAEDRKDLPVGYKRLHESTVENLQRQLAVLDSFNFTQDPELTAQANDLREVMRGVDADLLKSSAAKRREVREQLATLTSLKLN